MTDATRMVGRATELATLVDLIERARAGAGGVVAILGEPGIGKSALLAEAERVAMADARVLRARGVESETSLPFSGLHQLGFPVRGIVDRLPGAQAHALRGALGLEDGVANDPYLVSLGTLGLLSETAADGQVVVVVVDDFQWIDAASRAAVLFAGRRLAAEKVAILIACRTEDWPGVGDARFATLALDGLPPADAVSLLASRSEVAVPDDVARRLHAATGGNPLALVEVASELSARELRGEAPLPVHLPVTDGLERAFAARVGGMSDAQQRLLLVVAIDDTGRRDVIARAATSLGSPASGIDDAIRDRLLAEHGEAIGYRHPLIRSAVYGRAQGPDRRRVHAALAIALADVDPDRALRHRAAAADAPSRDLMVELDGLANRAKARGAFEGAMETWRRAADIAPSRDEAAAMLLAAAGAAWAAGWLADARDLLGRALDGPLTAQGVVEAAWLRGGIELAAGDATRAYRALVEAAQACAVDDPERSLYILNLAAEAASLSGDRTATADLAQIAMSVPHVAGDRVDCLRTALLGFAADFAGDMPSAVVHLRRAVDGAGRSDDAGLWMIGGRAAIYIGRDAAARDLHLAVVERARGTGSVDLVPIAAPRLAIAEMLLGRWASAEMTATETTRLADETGQLLLAPHGRLCLALLAAMRGRSEDSEAYLDQALAPVRGRRVGLLEDEARWIRAVTALGEQRPRDAVGHLAAVTHPVIEVFSGLDRLEAAAAVGDPLIGVWQDETRQVAQHTGEAWAVARAAYGAALMTSDVGVAASRFAAAVEAAERSTRPFERARIELAAGSFLRRHRQRVAARDRLRAALITFEQLGAAPWAERARSELRATGDSLPRPTRASVDALTPQELLVARTVAEGYPNKEVAARLFLSPRTVEFHLRNIFSKLGISSRTQLTRMALEDPAARSSPADPWADHQANPVIPPAR